MSHYELARKPDSNFKEVIFREDIINKVFPGIQRLAKAVASTLGPNGKNVIIKVNFGTTYTKDGVTVAKHIDFSDKYESLGAEMVKEVAQNTCDKVGDGTTQSTILVESIIRNGLQAISDGARVDELSRNIKADVEKVVSNLKAMAVEIETPQQAKDVATISANDRELGDLIGGIYSKIGKDGVIVVEESMTSQTFEEEVSGIRFNSGLVHPYFITNHQKQRSELENPYIFISDLDISSFMPFVNLLNKLIKKDAGKKISFVVIAHKVTGEALLGFINNHIKGEFQIACIEAPGFGLDREKWLQDVALVTGGEFISKELSIKIADIPETSLGRAEKVISGQNVTTIIGGKGEQEAIDNKIAQLGSESAEDPGDKELLSRISRLKNKVCVLKVGGETESEIREKKYRIEDAVESTKVALQGGVVVGGEVALLEASKDLEEGVVKSACRDPFRVLLGNIDQNPDDFIGRVSKDLGYNAQTEQLEDLFAAGIIDPALVPVTALTNAASVAINFLKTDTIVFNIKDLDEKTNQPLSIE